MTSGSQAPKPSLSWIAVRLLSGIQHLLNPCRKAIFVTAASGKIQ